jgi:energy-coupling factor transporter ATP-binding protein EcfA2
MPSNNEIKSWYNIVPDSMKQEYHNPSYNNCFIKHVFRCLIIGASGAGKTQLVVELIHRMENTFGNIVIVCKNKEEPLYKFLASKIKPEQFQIFEGIDEIPDLDSYFDKQLQNLVIFDDLVLEKDQSMIEQYFIRGRKIGKGISLCYLTQSYFATPKVIRLNCNYIFIKKLSSTRDLSMILNDFSLGIERDLLMKIYKFCTAEKNDFLLCDLDAPMESRFRRNFLEQIILGDEQIKKNV